MCCLASSTPFFTTKEVGKGTGLGLSMVYGFVKQSHGHVHLDSELGRGTMVRMYLPRADGPEKAGEDDKAAAAMAGGGETILLVEDDELVRLNGEFQLAALGYRVIAVANGAAAMAVLRQGGVIDLLFTDVIMPGGMNGRDLAAAGRPACVNIIERAIAA